MASLLGKFPPAVQQMIRYLLVGGSAFVLDFGLLALLRSGLGVPAWLAAAVAFAVSTLFSFLLQRRFTFSADLHVGNSAIRYGFLLATNMVLTSLIVEGFDRYLDSYLVGKIISTALTTLWNFPIMKFWVYPRRTVSETAAAGETGADNA
nr:GtrA family protein [Propionicimonas sp.]